MKIAVVKYNAGNIYSVNYALKRLGVEATITSDKELLMSADKVIFPGVGEAETTMSHLRKNRLDEVIKNLKQPVLGICLGMQLMCRHSEEGNAACLGIFDTDVKFTKEEFVYFVHSFYVPLNEFTAAQTDYILPYSSALHKDNFYATQFHPEKSGAVGERILRNFLEL